MAPTTGGTAMDVSSPGPFLVVGGNIGGADVFVDGTRVLKRPDAPVAKALDPLGYADGPL